MLRSRWPLPHVDTCVLERALNFAYAIACVSLVSAQARPQRLSGGQPGLDRNRSRRPATRAKIRRRGGAPVSRGSTRAVAHRAIGPDGGRSNRGRARISRNEPAQRNKVIGIARSL